jgi:hypothetical protein
MGQNLHRLIMFNLKDVSVGGGNKYIRPGVHEVQIISARGVENEGNPYVEMVFRKVGIEDESANDTQRIYNLISDNDQPATGLLQIKAIASCVLPENQTNFEAQTVVQLGSELDRLLKGKHLRIKFSGKEYVKQDGTVGTGNRLPRKYFCESITDGTAFPKTSKDESGLTFDKSNQYDIKRLPGAETGFLSEDSKDEGESSMPF